MRGISLPAVGLLCIAMAAVPPRQAAHKNSSQSRRGPMAKLPAAQRAAVQRWMRSLSLRDKVAQLVISPCFGEAINTRSRTYRKYVHQVRDLRVGGLIVLGHAIHGTVDNAEPYAMAAFLNRMQKLARIPLLVGADFEHGASMRVRSATPWPHNMAFTAADDLAGARAEGAATAREARALGVQWLFAPDADVNSNPDNPIINIRSYGEDPAEVGRFVSAFIEGAHSEPSAYVLTTAKHFPGHGNTSQDSHMGLARNDETRDQLESIDLAPFRAAVAAGVDAIMTAHMAVPAIETKPIPATVSSAVLTGLLRDELKFEGIVVTDALDMQGVTKLYGPREASVRALEAGADVLLMPEDPEDAIRGVVEAVKQGRISRQRLEESVIKLLAAKARVGLNRKKSVDLDGIADVFNSPEDNDRAQEVADRAVTLVKDTGSLLPLKPGAGACLTVLAESRHNRQGQHLIDEFRGRDPKMKTQLLDPAMSDADMTQAASAVSDCKVNVVAAYVTAAEYRGNTALAGPLAGLVDQLTAAPAPVVLVSLGNPYLVRSFPKVAAYLAAYSTVSSSETAVARALYGEIGIAGRLPVSIPGVAKIGEGIKLAASRAASTTSGGTKQ